MIFFVVSCTFLIQHLVVMDTINHLWKSLGKRLQKTIDHPFRRSQKKKTLPFHGVLQHIKNASMMLECEQCGMWRLLYAKSKLSVGERTAMQPVLDKWSFTCGAQLQDLNLAGCLTDIYVREMSCNESIEQLYYSAKYESICIYCATPQPATDPQFYPQCAGCRSRDRIRKG